MAHANLTPTSTDVIERRRRQAIMDRLSSELSKKKSLQKRRLLSSIKINKRKREVDEVPAEQPPSKRSRELEELEEGEILEDEPLTTRLYPRPLKTEAPIASNKENCVPSRPGQVTPAPTARSAERAIPSHSASPSPTVMSVTDIIRIINPAYILPPTMPLSRIPEDLEGRAKYLNDLQAFCNGLRRTVFKDEAELEVELKILRSIGTIINSKTIPHLPTYIEEALGQMSDGILEEEALPTLRRKLAMVLLCIVNLNKVRTAENPVVLGPIQ